MTCCITSSSRPSTCELTSAAVFLRYVASFYWFLNSTILSGEQYWAHHAGLKSCSRQSRDPTGSSTATCYADAHVCGYMGRARNTANLFAIKYSKYSSSLTIQQSSCCFLRVFSLYFFATFAASCHTPTTVLCSAVGAPNQRHTKPTLFSLPQASLNLTGVVRRSGRHWPACAGTSGSAGARLIAPRTAMHTRKNMSQEFTNKNAPGGNRHHAWKSCSSWYSHGYFIARSARS